jgi:hypothetical protein
MLAAILLKKESLTVVPICVTPAIIKMEMRPAISAYSIAVAPSALRTNAPRADREASRRAVGRPAASRIAPSREA